jgi:EAL domain-containing protein (putative c-di-GMP-specific phosphodiesterase class I)/CheY-like chemotaxis protein
MDTETHNGEIERKRPRLLVIDDDRLMRKQLGRLLNGKGYEAIVAQDGAEAQEIFAQATFDLVLTDVNMPKVDGITVLKQIRERDPDLPVIMFTGSPSSASAIGALQLRATAYLTKPINPGRLVEEIAKALKLHDLALVRKQAHELVQASMPPPVVKTEPPHRFERALDGLYMVYQPIVAFSERRVFGYEALVRSSEPSLPHPAALFSAAEQLERWNDLGRRIRDKSVEPCDRLEPGMVLLLNLHARELLDETLYDRASALAACAPRVVLEITERAHLDAVPDAASRIQRLREIGFRIAIDDIGAGYAGLSSFTMLRPDIIKLDLSLVRDIDKDPVKRRLVTLLVQLCRDLQIEVVGECVETAAECTTLVELGCNLLQGYLFGRPAAPFVQPVLGG